MTNKAQCHFRYLDGTAYEFECETCGGTITTSNKWEASQLHFACPMQLDVVIAPPQEPSLATVAEAVKYGPGAQLHRLIKRWTGEGITANCECRRRMAQMDAMGPAWCRENVEEIIGWLLEEAARRVDEAAKEGKSVGWRVKLGNLDVPGRQAVLRQIVLKAIKQAEEALGGNHE